MRLTTVSSSFFRIIPVFSILIATLLVFPLMLIAPSPLITLAPGIELFGVASISILSMGIVFFNHSKLSSVFTKYNSFPLCVLVVFAVALAHFLLSDTYSFENFAYSLIWISLPICVYLHSKDFALFLPIFLVVLWLVNFAHSIVHFVCKYEPVGLPGNRNWHANLLLVSTPFVLLSIKDFLKKRNFTNRSIYLIAAVPLSYSFFLFWICESRGAYLALVLVAIIIIYYSSNHKVRTGLRWLAMATIILAVSFFYYFGKGKAAEIIAKDVRIPMWEDTFAMISDNLCFGVGAASFESKYAPYRSIDYYLRSVASVRSNHPHNHFLFFIASYGLIAFLFWAFLVIYPVNYFFLEDNKSKSPKDYLFVLGFLIVLFHGMFDLLMYQWPSNLLALMFLGLIWSRVWPKGVSSSKQTKTSVGFNRRFLFCFTGFVLLIMAFVICYRTFYSTVYLREGLIRSEDERLLAESAVSFEKGLEYKKDPLLIYKAGVNAFLKLRNPEMTLKYFYLLNHTPSPNFAHSNGFIGLNLCHLNRPFEALPYLETETDIYPIYVGGWFNWHNALMSCGKKAKAMGIYQNILLVLRIKGLSINHLPMLLKEPKYDMHPHKIPADSLVLGKSKDAVSEQ